MWVAVALELSSGSLRRYPFRPFVLTVSLSNELGHRKWAGREGNSKAQMDEACSKLKQPRDREFKGKMEK